MTMERKIGEIFEYKGEWYQCVEDTCNNECYFHNRSLHKTIADINDNGFGPCNACFRNDNKSVIFKKLEKVGEPYGFQKRTFQTYKLHTIPFLSEDVELVAIPSKDNNTIEIEIKQTKEDMEEQHTTENYPTKEEKIAEKIANKVGENIQNQLEKDMNKLNLKTFNLESAKTGKPVCTRDGRKARIICFDVNCSNNYPIIALITEENGFESSYSFTSEGKWVKEDSVHDLMMLPEKKEGWVNIYKSGECYNVGDFSFSKEEIEQHKNQNNYIATVKISWEE